MACARSRASDGCSTAQNQPRRVPLSIRHVVVAVVATLVLAGCAGPDRVPPDTETGVASAQAPAMTMYRSPDCSCCHLWAEIARQEGWSVTSVDKLDMAAFKTQTGVPLEYASCHTTMIGDYFVEGHVPLQAVQRLLAERPDIDGIALPGMPAGSPGMGGTQEGPLEVLAITDGVAVPFGSY
jgi:hypothetical protein